MEFALFLIVLVIGSAFVNLHFKKKAVKNYYWRVLCQLEQDHRMMPPEHIANKLDISLWNVQVVVARLKQDGYLTTGHHGNQYLVRINYAGKLMIREHHDILMGQPWYVPPSI